MKMDAPMDVAKNRPAETATPIATVIALLIAKMLGVTDADTVAYIAIVLAFVPAAITWIVVLLRKKNEGHNEP